MRVLVSEVALYRQPYVGSDGSNTSESVDTSKSSNAGADNLTQLLTGLVHDYFDYP